MKVRSFKSLVSQNGQMVQEYVIENEQHATVVNISSGKSIVFISK